VLPPYIWRPASVLLHRQIAPQTFPCLIWYSAWYNTTSLPFIKILLWLSKDVLCSTSLFVNNLHQWKILLQLHIIQLDLITSEQCICVTTSHKFFGRTVVLNNKLMLGNEIRHSYNSDIFTIKQLYSDN
jgi:hypothetical protein